jgi:hypothetical protein
VGVGEGVGFDDRGQIIGHAVADRAEGLVGSGAIGGNRTLGGWDGGGVEKKQRHDALGESGAGEWVEG